MAVLERVRQGGGLVRHLTTSPSARRAWYLRVTSPANLFQPYNDTQEDRYPRVFSLLQHRLGDGQGSTIVSFGCSTGSEVFTLRRYLPAARILGVDISYANLAECRRRLRKNPGDGIEFRRAGDLSFLPASSVDAILCMAVFRHGDLSRPGTTRCDHRISFQAFDQTVAGFDRCLKAGGLLAIEFSNFRFADTPTASGYTCILVDDRPFIPQTPIFGPDNELIPRAAYGEIVFRKQP